MRLISKSYLLLFLIFMLLVPGVFAQSNCQSANDLNHNLCFNNFQEQYYAQIDEPPPGMPFPPDDEGTEQSRRKYLEQLRILKLLELLDLDENQDIEFIRLYRNHRKAVRENEKEHNLKVIDLSNGLRNNSISEEDIFLLTDDILRITNERFAIYRSFLEKSKKILSPEQYGKLVVFQERFERELLEQIRQFRNRDKFSPGHGRRGFGSGKQKTLDLN